jgi:hypothetical protein
MKDLEEQGLEFDKGGSFRGSTEQALEAVRVIIRTKFGGGMQELSQTFQGKVSTMQGYWAALQRSLGKPIMDSLTPAIEDAIKEFQRLTPIVSSIGKEIGTSLSGALHAFTSEEGGTLGERIGESFKSLGNTLSATLIEAFNEPIAHLQAHLGATARWWQMMMEEGNNLVKEDAYQRKLRGHIDEAIEQMEQLESVAPGSGATSWLGEKTGRTGDAELSESDYERERARISAQLEFLTKRLSDSSARSAEMDPRSFPNVEAEKQRILEEGVRVLTPGGEKSAQDFRDEASKHIPQPAATAEKENSMWSLRQSIASDAMPKSLFKDIALDFNASKRALGNIFGRHAETDRGMFSYSGQRDRTDASLNFGNFDPAKIANLLNPPTDRRDNSDLAEAIALRITSNGAFESLVRDVAAIARPQPGDLAAQF